MKNIEKKWTLFLIATFVTFFGIVNVLVKGTKAIETPVNEYFDDINFYKCVIDSYNLINETKYDYSYNLSDEEIASITYISCNDAGTEENVITSVKGLEKLVNLTNLKLENVNVSKLYLDNNDKLESLTVLSDDEIITNVNLNLLDKSELTYLELENVNIPKLDLNSNDNLETLIVIDKNNYIKETSLNLLEKTELAYLELENVNISELKLTNNNKLETLVVVDENDYITKTVLDLSNKENLINLELRNVNVSGLYLGNNDKLETLILEDNNKKLTNVNLNLLDKKNLIDLELENVNIPKLDLNSNDNLETLIVVDKNNYIADVDLNLFEKVELVDLELESVNISDIDLNANDKLKVLVLEDDNKMLTSVNLNLLEKTELTDLKLAKVKIDTLNLSNNNKLEHLYINDCFNKEIVLYAGGKYDLENPIMLSNDKNLGEIIWNSNDNEIALIKDNSVVETNKAGNVIVSMSLGEVSVIQHNIRIVDITSDKYTIEGDKIIVDTDNVEEIKENINYAVNIDLEIDISQKLLKVMYGENLLKEFNIVIEELEEIVFDSSLNIDNDKLLISGILNGATVSDIKEKIIPSDRVSILDKDNVELDGDNVLKTGDKVRISISSEESKIYTISVLGDINGDGLLTKEDVLTLGKVIITDTTPTGDEYISAADVNKDGKISLNDIIKLARHVVSGSGL